ncbi:MAG: UGSC family (seleno)protein, partial [Acidimicrobiales bacterium]
MTTMTTLATDTLTVLVPTNEVDPGRASLAPRPSSLAGLRLGVLDNGKPNSDRLLEALVAGLARATGLEASVWRRKPAIGRLAPAVMVDELVAQADVVVTGVGDCAGCCSCSIADAVMLEQRGVPVAALCTTEFATAAALAAAAAGAPGYGVAVVPHPLGSCTAAELAARADGIAGRVVELLSPG